MIERPTKERIKQALGDFEESTISMVERFPDGTEREVQVLIVRMLDGHLLTKLASRGLLEMHHMAAAMRFLTDCHKAGIMSGAVIDPGRIVVDGGNAAPAQENQSDAYGRVSKVLKVVAPMTKAVLIDIVLFEMSREAFAAKHKVKTKDHKDRNLEVNRQIRDALTDLDFRYYGHKHTQSGQHHEPDYRPAIPPRSDGA